MSAARPRNIDLRPTARTDIAGVLRCRVAHLGLVLSSERAASTPGGYTPPVVELATANVALRLPRRLFM